MHLSLCISALERTLQAIDSKKKYNAVLIVAVTFDREHRKMGEKSEVQKYNIYQAVIPCGRNISTFNPKQ